MSGLRSSNKAGVLPAPSGRKSGRASENVEPVADADKKQQPPCAWAIAATIASPSPAPPCAARCGPRRPARSARRSCSSASGGIPQPSSVDRDHDAVRVAASAQLDRACGSVYLTAFSSSASSAARSQVSSASSVTSTISPRRQAARRDLRPAHEARPPGTGRASIGPAHEPVGLLGPREEQHRSTMRSIRASSSKATSSSGLARRGAVAAARDDRGRSSPASAARARRRGGSRSSLLEQRARAPRRAPRPSASACTRRRACQTIARNIADISGTSKSSPQSWSRSNASARIEAPVPITTAPSTSAVGRAATRESRRAASG